MQHLSPLTTTSMPNTPRTPYGSVGASQQPLAQLEETYRRLRLFFSIALVALLGWVVVQTLFSVSPFGSTYPFLVLAIEFVWWLSLLTVLALLFKRVLVTLTASTRRVKVFEVQLENANRQITQKNALLEQSIKDVWAARKRFSLPAKIIEPGHYQIQDLFGGYRDVHVESESSSHKLVCACYVYEKEQICPHTIAAASLHLRLCSILRKEASKREAATQRRA